MEENKRRCRGLKGGGERMGGEEEGQGERIEKRRRGEGGREWEKVKGGEKGKRGGGVKGDCREGEDRNERPLYHLYSPTVQS